MNEKEWYNTKKLDLHAKDALLNFVVGARRIGKTTHFMEKALDAWDKDRDETMWLRNLKVELVDPTFTGGFLNLAKEFNWVDEGFVTFPEGVYTDKTKEEQVIHFQSISTASNRRGNATPNIKYMIFDEFMPENRKYPKRAHTMLMSLTKTVLSGRRDAKCYCLSNFISAANPYWVGFQVYPKQKLDVTYFPNKKIAIEICRGYRSAIEDDNPWNDLYKAGGYQDYASETEDSLFSLIKPVPRGGKLFHLVILKDDVTYGCTFKDGLIYFHEQKPVRDWGIYATRIQETSNKVGLIPKFYYDMIKEGSKNNILRFSTPNVMYAVLSTIYDTV